MPPVHVDPRKVHAFEDAEDFEAWLQAHHDRESEVWIKHHKKGSGLRSVTPKEAIDVVLCWGWIDAVRKALDETSFLQRYTPRTPRSIWSQINVANVARLIEEGRMRPAGQHEIDRAKADGRWDAAYRQSDGDLPVEFKTLLDADPQLAAAFAAQSAQNRFAMTFRVGNLKRPESRAARAAEYAEMLKRGESIH